MLVFAPPLWSTDSPCLVWTGSLRQRVMIGCGNVGNRRRRTNGETDWEWSDTPFRAIRSPLRPWIALDPGPMAQADPSRSLSFTFGTALPAPFRTFEAAQSDDCLGWTSAGPLFGRTSDGLPVDPLALREEVKSKYRAVAVDPHGSYHFHTGRPLARRLGYDEAVVAALPDNAAEALISVSVPGP